MESTISSDRARGSQEPCFVLGLGQYDTDITVSPCSYSTGQQFRAEFRRAVVIGIQQN